MAAMRQTQQQKMLQKLSPQQIQLMKLLQVPTANLEERIKEEIEENPALDYGEEEEEQDDFSSDGEADFEDNTDEPTPDDRDEIDLSEYLGDDSDIPDYRLKGESYTAGEDDNKTIPVRVENSFHEYLESQLSMLQLSEREEKIANQVIGSLDEDGYLRRSPEAIADDLAFSENLSVDADEVKNIVSQIQELDPAGIGASDLRECLLIQLRRKDQGDPNIQIAQKILTEQFEEFSKKHYQKICRSQGIAQEELKSVIDEIIKLNPRPGGNYSVVNKAESYVIPDFFIISNNGALELSLNSKNAPDLHISGSYKEMLKAYEEGDKNDKRQKDAVMFIKQKIDSARWFIDAIKQRQHTLLSTMETIMRYQEEFFITNDETTLKPMILKDIADRTGLDISTVSRVANSKYVQTEFGIYKLKYFFSESLSTDSGEEVSTREVKKILQDIIDEENKQKPLSDENLTKKLHEKGYNIARRTVAKYREQLDIPVARLRKEL